MNTLCWRSPLGPILLEEEGGAVTGLRFCGQEVPAQGPVSPVLAQAAAQLAEYFAGQRQSFTVPLAPRGTPFQQEVWRALCAIPYGQTRSYGQIAEAIGAPAAAMELPDGTLVTGKTSPLLGASAALLLNAIKVLGGIDHDAHLIAPSAIEPIQTLKTNYLGSKNPRLHTDEVLIALSMSAATDETARLALSQLPKLRGCQVHTSVMLSPVDIKIFQKLGVDLTSEPVYEHKRLYH